MRRNIPEPTISPEFTIDDIHRIREWNYECQKDMTPGERVADTASRGEEALRRLGLADTAKRLGK
ncbi:MAG: hypothetical protein LBT08_01300 [Synergistaceae bacterium]|jgi:hypothetical protein|nr:hypothetical protein [Synergistaceae bacterium]